MRTAGTDETPSVVRTPDRLHVGRLVVASLLVLAHSVLAGGPAPLTEEERRVALVAQLERSVVLVLAEGRAVTHARERLPLEPTEALGRVSSSAPTVSC